MKKEAPGGRLRIDAAGDALEMHLLGSSSLTRSTNPFTLRLSRSSFQTTRVSASRKWDSASFSPGRRLSRTQNRPFGSIRSGLDPFLVKEGFREPNYAASRLLSSAQREELLPFPTEEVDLIRNYTFSAHDLAVIRRCRGDHNRLGFSVQLCYLRFPGRLLGLDEVPYPPILGMAAAQLKVPTGAWNFYAEREETRREHLSISEMRHTAKR